MRTPPSSVLLWVLIAAAGFPLSGCGPAASGRSEAGYEALVAAYLDAWFDFHPSEAAAMGLAEYRDRAEDRSPTATEAWVAYNDALLARISGVPAGLPLDLRIDLRLIRNRTEAELARWRPEGPALDGSRTFPLGKEAFEAELRRYYGMDLTPEEVSERALDEIRAVRRLMGQTAAAHWRESRPGESVPGDENELLTWALARMEENRASNQLEFLELFTRFAREAEAFVREREIATLPAERTLEIVLTPASAGPAQRIGFVDPAPPFDPTAVTVLSLPTIEDSLPEGEKEDFYRSFNNHFNKAIIIHELFPGHYMQLKIASQNPRRARIVFPYAPFGEGWATLVERIALDAGWDDGNHLTYLAHLRKRMENANRAYTSVQAHCFGWTEEEVLRFSEEEALVAPQFAQSLWGRLQRSPMQMTSYFLGADHLTRILEAEKERLGEAFQVRAFTDRILRAGAVPFDMIPEVLASG